MAYWRFNSGATVEVSDHRNLKAAWKCYEGPARRLIGTFKIAKPLTAAQMRRLPAELRTKLKYADDSVAFLEALHGLEDTR